MAESTHGEQAAPQADVNFARTQAAQAPEVPSLYANSFLNVHTGSDVAVIFEKNSKPIAVMNLSYTTAKSLVVYLGQMISDIEQRSGRDIMTSDDVNRAFQPD